MDSPGAIIRPVPPSIVVGGSYMGNLSLGRTMPMNRRRFLKQAATTAAGACAGFLIAPSCAYAADDRVKRLVHWLRKSFVGGEIGLVPNLPSGKVRGGRVRDDLKNLYWLQNCNLFAMHALRGHDDELAAKIEQSYRRWYATAFPDIEERTENHLTVGGLPAVQAPDGHFFRTIVKRHEGDGFTIGTETFDPKRLGRIKDNDPRGLLKFGVLGSHLRGDKQRARDYFTKAISLWDGRGFTHTRMQKHGAYYTRYLAYALIAERMLGASIPPRIRAAIRSRLWSVQDIDGGLWTNYNADGTIPPFAKKTTEIGPLALLSNN